MIAATSTVIQDIVDNAEERELWIVAKEHERPPFFHEGKGGDTRLARAIRVCFDGKITPNSDGSYTVEGSAGRTYRVTNSCTCPHSQSSKSKYCYHFVAVCLYIEWQKRLRPAAPVALGTLRAGTLPLPPVTADERLAAHAEALVNAPEFTHLPAQEDRMADDEYIPEPDDENVPPVAVVDAPERKEERKEGLRPLPDQVLLPSLDARTLEQSMQAYAAQRAVVTRYIKEQMTEGVDYYTLTIKGRVSKATLSKAGSEKFLSLFQLSAQFQQDEATWRMLGAKEGLLCYTCTLMTRQGEVIGEGRGARSVTQDGGDINKAIKMATKSAQVDAVLRTGALSDVFTQDLESDEEPAKAAPPVKPNPLHPSAALRQRIWAKVQELAPEARTREAVEALIKERTGMDLHPDLYSAILARLEERQ